jgi:hypothetical protein
MMPAGNRMNKQDETSEQLDYTNRLFRSVQLGILRTAKIQIDLATRSEEVRRLFMFRTSIRSRGEAS